MPATILQYISFVNYTPPRVSSLANSNGMVLCALRGKLNACIALAVVVPYLR